MKKEDFVAYATFHANQTSNVRILPVWDSSGVARVDDTVAGNFAAIIKLLQNNIHTGGPAALCSQKEFLLIYNFQPVEEGFFSIDIIVKPIKDIEDLRTHTCDLVETLDLVVDQSSTEVMNGSMYCRKFYPEDAYAKPVVPQSYGYYCDFIDIETSYKNHNTVLKEAGAGNNNPPVAIGGNFLVTHVFLPLYSTMLTALGYQPVNNKTEKVHKVDNNETPRSAKRQKLI